MHLPLEAIGNYVALHNPDFDDLNFNALNRAVVFEFAQILGINVDDAAIEAECRRFQKKRNLLDQAELSTWLERNHLSDEEFRDLMTQVALCRRIHRWFLIAIWIGRSTKPILDELRLRDDYVNWVERTAAQERLLQAVEPDMASAEASRIPLEDLAAEHAQWTDWTLDIDVTNWTEEAGFHSEDNLRMEFSRARSARRALLEMIAEAITTPDGQEALASRGPLPLEDSDKPPPNAEGTR
jgi:hypothetical protein